MKEIVWHNFTACFPADGKIVIVEDHEGNRDHMFVEFGELKKIPAFTYPRMGFLIRWANAKIHKGRTYYHNGEEFFMDLVHDDELSFANNSKLG